MPYANPLTLFRTRVERELYGRMTQEPPIQVTLATGRSCRWKGYRVMRRGAEPALLTATQCRSIAKAPDLNEAINRLMKEPLQ
jgi:hypothetical protein